MPANHPEESTQHSEHGEKFEIQTLNSNSQHDTISTNIEYHGTCHMTVNCAHMTPLSDYSERPAVLNFINPTVLKLKYLNRQIDRHNLPHVHSAYSCHTTNVYE
jgi:hypothetical protein